MTSTISWVDVDHQLPDADETVMVFCPVSDDPVWLGYWDGETWRGVDGGELGEKFVSAWATMPDPASVAQNSRRRSRRPACNPVEALVSVERMIRGTQVHQMAVDRAGKVGLGQWILRVVARCRKGGM